MMSNESDAGSQTSQTTPMLNTLLSKPTADSNSMPPPQHQFSSPQQSPVPNGDRYPTGAPNTGDVPPSSIQHPSHMQPPPHHGMPSGHPGQPPVHMMTPQPHHMGAPPGMPTHPGYPPGYPPAYFQQRLPPGYPPSQMYPPGVHPSQFPPSYPPHHMMRPGMTQSELVKMPNGPTPAEWAAAQQHKMKDGVNPATPGSMPAPSPVTSNMEDPMEEHKRMESPGGWNQMQRPPMAHHMPPQQAPQPPRRQTIVDQLVGPPTPSNPPRVMPERRAFFDRLVNFCEQHGDPITMVPQVSKQNVDLHRLYIAVRNRGGFEQVTKDKAWKSICPEANPEISESSAAGYQLRKHYQRHLLLLECVETGRDADQAIAFADKLKKKRKPTDPGTAGVNASPATPSTPASGLGASASQSTPQPSPYGGPPSAAGAEAAYYYQQQAHDGRPHPGGWPPGSGGPPGYPPPGAFRGIPPGVTPMRAPPSQQHMPDLSQMDEQQRQQYIQQQQAHAHQQAQAHAPPTSHPDPSTPSQSATPAPPATPGQPGTPASQTGNSLQVDSSSQAGSRAPSAGPPPAASTPDSNSRLSGGGEEERGRPPSQTPSQPSTSMAAVTPSGAPSPYYPHGQPPPMYAQRPGMPPGAPGMRPPGPYPPGYGPPPHGYPSGPGMTPQQHQYMQQQQYWQQQQQRQQHAAGYPGPVPPGGVAPSPGAPSANTPQRGYYPRMNQQGPPQGAPSPGQQQHRMNYSQAAASRVPQPSVPSGYPPHSAQSSQQPQPNRPSFPSDTPSSSSVHPQQQQQQNAPPPMPQMAPPPSFPSNCVESTQPNTRKRKRLTHKDLYGASSRRLLMSLRSGLETETIWALNCLSVQLHDDHHPGSQPKVVDQPGMLNTLVEHLWATLSVLWPHAFKLSDPYRMECKDECALLRDDLIEEAMKGDKVIVEKEVVTMRGGNGDKKKKTDLTTVTRTGRMVKFEKAEMPAELRRLLVQPGPSQEKGDVSLSPSYLSNRQSMGLAGGLAERVANRLRNSIDSLPVSTTHFSRYENKKKEEDELFVVPMINGIVKEEMMDDGEELSLHIRGARKTEWRDGPIDYELSWQKRSAIVTPNEAIQRVANRCLSISNLLRSVSFIVGNEPILSRHDGLLYLCGRFLRLLADERPFKRTAPLPKFDKNTPLPEPESVEEQRRKSVALLDDENELECILLETATILREDALTVLCHLAGFLDLYDRPSTISYPIFDGLLHWCTTSVPQANDPLGDGVVSPRNYALEVLCKLSVIDSNVDLLVSTGEWARMERMGLVLARLINMNEETHIREFSIVILNALCAASDELTWSTAHSTPAIQHLIAFIETADQNMHQVMQQHGMPALRDNPELMGTSVGMLRRAAGLLRGLTKAKDSYKLFAKFQQRLLQFTMSQLMDSRVAGMVADTLFQVQTALSKLMEEQCEKEIVNGGKKEKSPSSMDTPPCEKTTSTVEESGVLEKSDECMDTTEDTTKDATVVGEGDSPSLLKKLKREETLSTRSAVPNGIHTRENGGSMTAVA